ncbi:hypothetical protein EVAR_8432_1 [Eumeta japonica]|uniref:Uncharacterized protein n=1 Tax=Eumeta variegata TaxID=151549 RepID=A0A4C1WF71_EUMVA|nr:hypothetical protein EVAR_8432_1 [Eumeta japonica]
MKSWEVRVVDEKSVALEMRPLRTNVEYPIGVSLEDSDFKERCGLEGDVVTRVEKGEASINERQDNSQNEIERKSKRIKAVESLAFPDSNVGPTLAALTLSVTDVTSSETNDLSSRGKERTAGQLKDNRKTAVRSRGGLTRAGAVGLVVRLGAGVAFLHLQNKNT